MRSLSFVLLHLALLRLEIPGLDSPLCMYVGVDSRPRRVSTA